MKIVFDSLIRTFSFDETQGPCGHLACEINRHGQTINLRGLSFGVVVKADGEAIFTKDWPPGHMKYVSTDQDRFIEEFVGWQPGQVIQIDTWLQAHWGDASDSYTFTEPVPPEPELSIEEN